LNAVRQVNTELKRVRELTSNPLVAAYLNLKGMFDPAVADMREPARGQTRNVMAGGEKLEGKLTNIFSDPSVGIETTDQFAKATGRSRQQIEQYRRNKRDGVIDKLHAQQREQRKGRR
jgi:hypothetical protein